VANTSRPAGRRVLRMGRLWPPGPRVRRPRWRCAADGSRTDTGDIGGSSANCSDPGPRCAWPLSTALLRFCHCSSPHYGPCARYPPGRTQADPKDGTCHRYHRHRRRSEVAAQAGDRWNHGSRGCCANLSPGRIWSAMSRPFSPTAGAITSGYQPPAHSSDNVSGRPDADKAGRHRSGRGPRSRPSGPLAA
jgi:hypothetical protein